MSGRAGRAAACRGSRRSAFAHQGARRGPPEIAASVGLDLAALQDPENSIPFSAAGKLLQAAAVRTGCAHFGLLLGQRNDTRSLGLVGRLMRSAPTWGRAALDLVDNQHRYVRGGAPYLVARDGV